ncbi:hypothetical protein TNCV_2708371 [Trichonephila clavipes]|nr:hypothetical protein TNCV_2708371 [Trichonephila clavipes]
MSHSSPMSSCTPSRDPVKMLMLCGNIVQPSWGKYHLFVIYPITWRPLVTIEPFPLERAHFKPANESRS